MASVRRSDNHRSNAVRLDQRFRVRKDSGARRSRLRAGGIGVEDSLEMRVGGLATEKARMFGTHHARTKDTHADAHLFAPIGFPRLNAFWTPSISSQWPSYCRRGVDRPAGRVTPPVSSGHQERALLPRLRPTPIGRN